MLKGKEFGKAIGRAIQLKLDSGAVPSKAAIARHFEVQPPSLSDWVKKGSISKDKLPEVWRYFSDVVGPEHWGMSRAEWPSGLVEPNLRLDDPQRTEQPPVKYSFHPAFKPETPRSRKISKIVAVLNKMDDAGLAVVLDKANEMAREYPATKANAG